MNSTLCSVLAAILFLASTAECTTMNKLPVKDCGSVMGKPTGVATSANYKQFVSLIRGTNVTFQVNFTVNEEVTSATAKVYGDLIGVKIPFPLSNPNGCKDSNLVCPLKTRQNYSYLSVIEVKKSYPKVKVIVLWKLLDQKERVIWCVAVPAEIVD